MLYQSYHKNRGSCLEDFQHRCYECDSWFKCDDIGCVIIQIDLDNSGICQHPKVGYRDGRNWAGNVKPHPTIDGWF